MNVTNGRQSSNRPMSGKKPEVCLSFNKVLTYFGQTCGEVAVLIWPAQGDRTSEI